MLKITMPTAQTVQHGASNAEVMGLTQRESINRFNVQWVALRKSVCQMNKYNILLWFYMCTCFDSEDQMFN